MGCLVAGSPEKQAAEEAPDPFPEDATREDMMKMVFQQADADGNGHLTLAEFQKLNDNSDDPAVKEQMKKIFELADKGSWFSKKDQKLSEKEFIDFNIEYGGDDDAAFRQRAKVQYYLAQSKNKAES
eukprot:CAMPEP_0179302012 /NCGR_PEP_ID=MMETSP0797-20121207/47844_1 /TAXON_ID=47934 /ORGANISM="Dinophysis acuminata, Strain DAEP01" /LENGTH=126 /DNA_ID=CAMNT_0021011527 /DNA_START=76 /DNA_END=457 /DNA_ORIENTATION=-